MKYSNYITAVIILALFGFTAFILINGNQMTFILDSICTDISGYEKWLAFGL